jgi:hypothetical protein
MGTIEYALARSNASAVPSRGLMTKPLP